MEAKYLFVTDCPESVIPSGGASSALNEQQFTVRNADDGNFLADDTAAGSVNFGRDGAAQGPSSIRLTLTYDFPNIRGGSVATGDTDQEFNISAVVRGGNVCASRKVSQQQ